MTTLYFSKNVEHRLQPGEHLDLPDWSKQERPEQYVIEDDGLVAAVNAALILGQPLLLTGEPGTGKTTLAGRVAWQLGLENPLTFETKSTSIARDLFYTYDAVGRFQAAQHNHGSTDNLDFITFQALGKAIILAGNSDQSLRRQVQRTAVEGKTGSGDLSSSRRSVVLIDEIDKAHRDFPNDLLNEIDRMFFTIPERGNQRIGADAEFRPFVIITSNSEKNLPDPFLRRCVYYHIEFPNMPALERILRVRLGLTADEDRLKPAGTSISGTTSVPNLARGADDGLIQSAVRFFLEIRDLHLRKNPATAELIGWTRLLLAFGAKLSEPLSKVGNLKLTLAALAKNQDDLAEVTRYLDKVAGVKGFAASGAN